MKRSLLAVVAMAAAALLTSTTPAAAITDGEPDGQRHPYVGLMVALHDTNHDGVWEPMWRCSGTLLSPTVFLTAGHCTGAPDEGVEHVEIWFDSDVESGIPANGYPTKGQVGGTPHTYPGFTSQQFTLHDVGVVVLDTPHPAATYGTLPAVDQLDALKPGAHTTFTAVGYGMQKSYPDATAWKDEAKRVRYLATPHLEQINNGKVGRHSMQLSNNAHTGGTCFGDSGGPNFLGDSTVVAGVTSYGKNGNCAGTGGVFRVDRADVQDFIKTYLH